MKYSHMSIIRTFIIRGPRLSAVFETKIYILRRSTADSRGLTVFETFRTICLSNGNPGLEIEW